MVIESENTEFNQMSNDVFVFVAELEEEDKLNIEIFSLRIQSM